MANSSSGGRSLAERLREVEVNPIFPIIAAVVVVGIVVYFGWLRPKMADDKAVRDFNTPEAQARRDPDQRKADPAKEQELAALRAKEQHINPGVSQRRRRDN